MKGISSTVAQLVYSVASELLVDRDLAVFLCGASVEDHSSLRRSLKRSLLANSTGGRRVQIYYPEDLYSQLLFDPKAADLLSLENKLATNADAVVVVGESVGALCELGAFANSEVLRPKLIAVMDEQYKGKRSFIMSGPIKLLARLDRQHVLYHSFRHPKPVDLASQITRTVRKLGPNWELDVSLHNPIVSELFCLFAAYIVNPLSLTDLISMTRDVRVSLPTRRLALSVEHAEGEDKQMPLFTQPFSAEAPGEIPARASVTCLISHGELQQGDGAYSLTSKGEARVEHLLGRSSAYRQLREMLDAGRVTEMNRSLRRCAQREGRVHWKAVRGGASPPCKASH
ncbi:MAG: retron St85 family effector protein [Armatimonadota bacterium]